MENPDRHLECGECKKPIAVHYTEVVGKQITCWGMCADCPMMQRHLFGTAPLSPVEVGATTGLACGNCGTTFDSVRMGAPLGCSTCYQVFDEVILAEILAAKKVPPRILAARKSTPIHIGRAPGELGEINPAARLLVLNEALSETLKSEDYEQAAWLRDQIKALTETEEKGNEKP